MLTRGFVVSTGTGLPGAQIVRRPLGQVCWKGAETLASRKNDCRILQFFLVHLMAMVMLSAAAKFGCWRIFAAVHIYVSTRGHVRGTESCRCSHDGTARCRGIPEFVFLGGGLAGALQRGLARQERRSRKRHGGAVTLDPRGVVSEISCALSRHDGFPGWRGRWPP